MRTLSFAFFAVLFVSASSFAQTSLILICTKADSATSSPAQVVLQKAMPGMENQLTRSLDVQPHEYDMIQDNIGAHVTIEVKNHWLNHQDIRVKMMQVDHLDLNHIASMTMRPVEDLELVDLSSFVDGVTDDILEMEQYKRWLTALAN